MVRKIIQLNIGKPTLVRETSFHWTVIPHFIIKLFSFKENKQESMQSIQQKFQNIILSVEDKSRVVCLARASRHTKQSESIFRHVLLYGPPGTGS